MLAACSGADARRAQEILAQAQIAQAKVGSASYDVRMVMSLGDQRFTILMTGGGYLKGPRAGDQHLSMTAEGLPVPFQAELVTSRGRGYLRMNGAWQSFPVPAQARGADSSWAGTVGDLTRYVKDVDVREHSVVAGVSGTTVVGVLDTAGLLRAASQLSTFSQAAGTSSLGLDELAKHASDTRVVLFVAAKSHLVRSAVISFDFEAEGRKLKVDLYYSLRKVNRPVTIPSPY